MTANQFRKLALAFPDAVESSHMKHPDFRRGGKVFASLGSPDEQWAMVKLTPAQQKAFMKTDSAAFQAASGAWGRNGYTKVLLTAVDKSAADAALEAAFENLA